jgi:hypothetical protein
VRVTIGGELRDGGVKSRLYSAYKNTRLSHSNLYGPMGMFASSNSGARNMERAARSFRKPRRNHTGAFANVLGSSVQGRGATLFHLNNDCGVHWFLV